jgi:hypothetical protein
VPLGSSCVRTNSEATSRNFLCCTEAAWFKKSAPQPAHEAVARPTTGDEHLPQAAH